MMMMMMEMLKPESVHVPNNTDLKLITATTDRKEEETIRICLHQPHSKRH